MKRICFITAARSEYGILRWLISDIKDSGKLRLQLIVTGGHLLKEQGHTVDQIKEDGLDISAIVDAKLDIASEVSIAESMGRMAQGFAAALSRLRPDTIVVLGDRYELLPICSTALLMNIPIIHIAGGDITEGAIDDDIRNAVTMLATYHFPGTESSAQNVRRMRGSEKNIWAVGELGLDAFNRLDLISRQDMAGMLGLDIQKKWGILTYHPETKKSLDENMQAVKNCISVLNGLTDHQIVITYSNADLGGRQINNYFTEMARSMPERYRVIPSLGRLRYLSCMEQVELVIGNSSSGICEAPFLKKPVINIGDRQKGRYQCDNVVQCGTSEREIKEAIGHALNKEISDRDLGYWGDGHTSERIQKIIYEEIYRI